MPKGGYREGSGRKKITENRLDIKLYMRVSEEEQLLIKEKANKNNISVSEYIRQAVLDKISIEAARFRFLLFYFLYSFITYSIPL
ncbi:DUF6290 family protein [Brachyspira hyodysenteriae]|uniref:DUF6290 family protein n=1 Tax=Brachyspira hyodysenteriae TaxID=159 RepID=UPI0022CD45D5|nr:DUF6290 family protein [Brachyspira hyodysenteriae]MCZ9840617.1 DUF6290 family protein [Brachyspira hyodysenteriae]